MLLCRVKPSAGLRWKVSSRCSRSRRRAAMSNRRIEQWPGRRGPAQSAGPVDRRDRYPISSSSAGRMERGLGFLDEFLQLFRIDVADGKELETLWHGAFNCAGGEPRHRCHSNRSGPARAWRRDVGTSVFATCAEAAGNVAAVARIATASTVATQSLRVIVVVLSAAAADR